MRQTVKAFFWGAVVLAAFAFPAAADEFSSQVSTIAESTESPESFAADLSAEFGIPASKLSEMRTAGMSNGDLYFACELSRQAKKPIDAVIDQYKKNKGKGWGAIAKELGVKPGSPEFKALKTKSGEKARKEKGKKGKRDRNKSAK